MAVEGGVKLYYDSGETRGYALRNMRYELDPGGVAVVTFDDAATLNALTPNFLAEVFVVLEHARRDAAVRAVVWTGAGKAWSSGAALGGDRTVHVPRDAAREYARRGMWMAKADRVAIRQTLAFWDFPKPSVAAVQGMALGGAANMALCNNHDLVYCSEAARFKWPFVKIGATPEVASSRLLPFLIGFAKTKELLMLGEWIGARDAQRLGLVNKVLPADRLLPEALAVARRLAAEPNQAALRLGKRVINSYVRRDLEDVLNLENATLLEALKARGKASNASLMGAAKGKPAARL